VQLAHSRFRYNTKTYQDLTSNEVSGLCEPLVLFTSDRRKMGQFTIPRWLQLLAWLTAGVIVLLNVKFLLDFCGITEWLMRVSH